MRHSICDVPELKQTTFNLRVKIFDMERAKKSKVSLLDSKPLKAFVGMAFKGLNLLCCA